MDPISNPTPTPNPVPTPAPDLNTPDITLATTEPVAPAEPVAPVSSPVPPVAPAAPVNPVITPGGSGANPSPAPVNPVYNPTGVGVAATDPIMMPEQPKAPDPIEEELKAPMKAAAPAPGSIGSAVSGPMDIDAAQPADGPMGPVDNPFDNQPAQTPSVAFTDPATQSAVGPMDAKPAKKNNKTTLMLLIVVVVIIIIGLGAVLAMQFLGGDPNGGNGGNSGNSGNNGGGDSSVVVDDEDEKNEGGEEEEESSDTNSNSSADSISCTANQDTLSSFSDEDITFESITISMIFKDSVLDRVEFNGVALDNSGVEQKQTVTYNVSQFLDLTGLSPDELEEAGMQYDDDGNPIISKATMNSAIKSGLEGYTCISPDRM